MASWTAGPRVVVISEARVRVASSVAVATSARTAACMARWLSAETASVAIARAIDLREAPGELLDARLAASSDRFDIAPSPSAESELVHRTLHLRGRQDRGHSLAIGFGLEGLERLIDDDGRRHARGLGGELAGFAPVQRRCAAGARPRGRATRDRPRPCSSRAFACRSRCIGRASGLCRRERVAPLKRPRQAAWPPQTRGAPRRSRPAP